MFSLLRINDLSLNDWDLKEHQGLREVEKILDRADEILEVRLCLIIDTGWKVTLNLLEYSFEVFVL